jgi:hypothetical protein
MRHRIYTYIHLFLDGSHVRMTVWINPNEILRPATLQGRPTNPNLQREFEVWQKFIGRHIEDEKASWPALEQEMELPT